MNAFWSNWVVILTALNIVGALWLLYVTSRKKPGEKGPSEETTGHTWDGDLREYNNPLPRWWLWGFYGSVIFSLGYLAFEPEDAWGRPLRLLCPGHDNPRRYDLMSDGPDGIFGGLDRVQ